ncbi:DNA-dependent RNA polymerase subunit epsilon [Salsuginibacillus halophilus]|nr:RNA polymerase epsilon subunit [Salsuginibacillus halophilus]
MIYKVFYQDNFNEVAVRERTNAMFVEAETEREVREKLAHKNYNIEHIEKAPDALIEYEKNNNEDFKVEEL